MKRSFLYAMLLTGACLALAALTLTATGCSTLAKAVNIENPRYSIRDLRPRLDIALPLSASSIDFDFTLGVDNPNSVGIKLSGVDFNLLVNGNPLLNSNTTQNVSIPARGFGEVRLRSRVDYNSIRNIWREVADVIQGNRARYELRGNAHYDTPVGRLTFPVTVYSTGSNSPSR
jgi:LEA14-like dessication related protein